MSIRDWFKRKPETKPWLFEYNIDGSDIKGRWIRNKSGTLGCIAEAKIDNVIYRSDFDSL